MLRSLSITLVLVLTAGTFYALANQRAVRLHGAELAAQASQALLADAEDRGVDPGALWQYAWNLGEHGTWSQAIRIAAEHPLAVHADARGRVILLTLEDDAVRYAVHLYEHTSADRMRVWLGLSLPPELRIHGVGIEDGRVRVECEPQPELHHQLAARSQYGLDAEERRWIELDALIW